MLGGFVSGLGALGVKLPLALEPVSERKAAVEDECTGDDEEKGADSIHGAGKMEARERLVKDREGRGMNCGRGQVVKGVNCN